MHVLVVEDDPQLRRTLELSLTAHGYQVEVTGTGEDALILAGRRPPDLLLLDLGLPGMDGSEVILGLREWTQLPIIVLSARGAEADKVQALDAGANDYLTKPFGVDELLARIRVALRARRETPDPVVATHGFVVDFDRHEVTRDGELVHLTPIEWGLLTHLVQSAGQLVSQQALLRAVWGPEYGDETNYLRVHMTHLRHKLEPDPGRPQYFITEPGLGYRFRREPH
jgi:two-component system, OmpR family, KDP operon response regulator KdpE